MWNKLRLKLAQRLIRLGYRVMGVQGQLGGQSPNNSKLQDAFSVDPDDIEVTPTPQELWQQARAQRIEEERHDQEG